MWFSPVKGAYMTLGQVDKTATVKATTAADKAKVKRGMFLALDTDGTFIPYPDKDKPGDIPYICLQDYNDYTAAAAGSGAEAYENTNAAGNRTQYGAPVTSTAVGPRVTGLSVLMPGEYQTTAFATDGDYAIGTALVVVGGMLAPAKDTGNVGNVVGYVTKAPFERWINDLHADDANYHLTGGKASVLQWATHFVPTTDASATTDKKLKA